MKLLRILPFLLFFTSVNLLYAEVKVGIVDIAKIMQKSKAFKDAMEKIDARAEDWNKNAVKMQKKFTQEYDSLSKQKNVLSSDEYNKRRDMLDKEAEKVEKKFYVERTNIDKESGEVNNILIEKARAVAAKFAAQEGIGVLLNKSIVFYNDEAIDITDKVIIEVNEELKSIDIKLSNNRSRGTK